MSRYFWDIPFLTPYLSNMYTYQLHSQSCICVWRDHMLMWCHHADVWHVTYIWWHWHAYLTPNHAYICDHAYLLHVVIHICNMWHAYLWHVMCISDMTCISDHAYLLHVIIHIFMMWHMTWIFVWNTYMWHFHAYMCDIHNREMWQWIHIWHEIMHTREVWHNSDTVHIYVWPGTWLKTHERNQC